MTCGRRGLPGLLALLALLPPVLSQPWPEGRFVRFVEPAAGERAPNMVFSTSDRRIEWRGGWPTVLRVVAVSRSNLALTLSCGVDRLSGKDTIKFMDFCFKKDRRKVACKTLNPSANSGEVKLAGRNGLTVPVKFDAATGGSATVHASVAQSLDGLRFDCVAVNRRGAAATNQVVFFDYRSKVPTDIWQPSPPAGAFSRNGPATFKCLPSPLGVEMGPYVKYRWRYCATADLDGCSVLDIDPKWPVQILANGDLYWPYVPSAAATELAGKRLTCYVLDVPVATYTKPLAFTDSSPAPVTTLSLIRPSGTVAVALSNSSQVATLPCIFKVGPGPYKVTWAFVKGVKSTPIADGLNEERKVTLSGSRLRFRGPFPSATEGEYRCSVEWTPTGASSPQRASGSYRVTADDIPRIDVTKMPSVVPVIDGSDGEVTCTFTRPKDIVPIMTVCGQLLDFSSVARIRGDIKKINETFAAVMAPLNASFSVVRPRKGDVLTYTVRRMVYGSGATHLSSAHAVECIGYSGGYSVRRQILLTVVARLKLRNMMWRCEGCDYQHSQLPESSRQQDDEENGVWDTTDALLDDWEVKVDSREADREFSEMFQHPSRLALTERSPGGEALALRSECKSSWCGKELY